VGGRRDDTYIFNRDLRLQGLLFLGQHLQRHGEPHVQATVRVRLDVNLSGIQRSANGRDANVLSAPVCGELLLTSSSYLPCFSGYHISCRTSGLASAMLPILHTPRHCPVGMPTTAHTNPKNPTSAPATLCVCDDDTEEWTHRLKSMMRLWFGSARMAYHAQRFKCG